MFLHGVSSKQRAWRSCIGFHKKTSLICHRLASRGATTISPEPGLSLGDWEGHTVSRVLYYFLFEFQVIDQIKETRDV